LSEALPLTERFDKAVAYAGLVHGGQPRKGTSIPYVSHLLAVCALVLEDGGDEDEAIAALLHDAVEDGGGAPRLEHIRLHFGNRVASIVQACSDTDQIPKPPWKERKTRYIAHIRDASPEARRVSCADKVHNARSILRDYRALGEELWKRLNASGDETLWYYRELVRAFRQPDATPVVDELDRVVSDLEAIRSSAREDSPQNRSLGGQMVRATDCLLDGKIITVEEALSIRDEETRTQGYDFRCVECGEQVRPHKAGHGMAAHFEHLRRNEACTRSDPMR